MLIWVHSVGQLQCLVIKVDSRMRGMKHALKQTQSGTIKEAVVILPLTKMSSYAMIHSMICVMDVELRI